MSSGTMEFESIGWHIPHVPTTLFFAWIVWAVLIVMSIVVAKRAKLIPGGPQVIFEMLIEYICGLADELIGPEARKFYPLFIGLFFFILISNLIGFIPGLVSPTADPNLTFGLAIMVFLYFIFIGFKYNGIGYLRQFKGPKTAVVHVSDFTLDLPHRNHFVLYPAVFAWPSSFLQYFF